MTAPAELVIEVTADDIRLGEPRQACLCSMTATNPLPAPSGGDPGWWRVVLGLLAITSLAVVTVVLVIPGVIWMAARQLARLFRRHGTEAAR